MSRQYWSECLAWSTSDGTAVANKTTEDVIFPNITLPANFMQDGRVLRIQARGRISNVVTAQPTLTVRLRLGGTSGNTICATSALTCSATAFTNAIWSCYIDIITRTNGSAGTLMGMGEFWAGNLATVAPSGMGSAGATTPATSTFDLTQDLALSFTAQWSAANASNSIQGINYLIEALN